MRTTIQLEIRTRFAIMQSRNPSSRQSKKCTVVGVFKCIRKDSQRQCAENCGEVSREGGGFASLLEGMVVLSREGGCSLSLKKNSFSNSSFIPLARDIFYQPLPTKKNLIKQNDVPIFVCGTTSFPRKE